ncbi:transmembrane protein 192 isoform X2 [Corythoichthys intestinalis]|nr:transmembrane protein 192 isoform X2 [Corythoichthys intestinalis]
MAEELADQQRSSDRCTPRNLKAGSSTDMTRSEEESLVDGPLISADALHAAIRREFRGVPTACPAVLLSLLHVVFVVLSACVSLMCVLKLGHEEACAKVLGPERGDSVVVFAKAVLWLLVAAFTRCARHHQSKARRRGYLRFYRKTATLHSVPLAVHSAGNAVLLVVVAAPMSAAERAYALVALLVLELLVALPCLIYYTVKVMMFNAERAPPDVSREERWHRPPTETGFREGSCLEEVVEKQADLIEYLKQHNGLLSKRLLNLTAQH